MRKTSLVLGTAAILVAAMFHIEFTATGQAQESQRTQRMLGMQRNTLPRQNLFPRQNASQNYHWASVVDADTQRPLAGVKATLQFARSGSNDMDTRVARSDNQGRIFFPLPSALNADQTIGFAAILLERDGYVTDNSIGRPAQLAERFLKEGKTVCDTLPLHRAEQISGRLVDDQGRPLANVLVAVQRQKANPYGNEGLNRTVSWEYRSDANGRFRIDAARNERVTFWAVPDNCAPQCVFSDQQRGDLGNITLERGFEPVVAVLDKDGKPVQNVWVNLNRRNENDGMAMGSAYIRSALTNREGQARFRPVSQGDYEICVSERPSECRYNPWSMFANVNGRERRMENPRPVKGTYFITPVQFSAASSQASLHAQNTVNVDVRFSDREVGGFNRSMHTSIYGRQSDGRYFVSSLNSDSSSSGYRGNGLFSFQVPAGLENASLRLANDTSTSHRAKMNGSNDWLEARNNSVNPLRQNPIMQTAGTASQGNVSLIPSSDRNEGFRARSDSTHTWIETDNGTEFPLGSITQATTIDVTAYRSPMVILNVVNESGEPVREYYAWMGYARNTPAKINVEGNTIRVEASARQHELNWDLANSGLPLGGILDVSFCGRANERFNADGILPNEAMNLYVVGRGYSVQMQSVPAMPEGEQRTLTVTLKK